MGKCLLLEGVVLYPFISVAKKSEEVGDPFVEVEQEHSREESESSSVDSEGFEGFDE